MKKALFILLTIITVKASDEAALERWLKQKDLTEADYKGCPEVRKEYRRLLERDRRGSKKKKPTTSIAHCTTHRKGTKRTKKK